MAKDKRLLVLDDEYETEYSDIVTLVIASLRAKETDYCFSKKDMRNIIAEAERLNLSLCYKEYLTKDNELDYFKVIPVSYSICNGSKEVAVRGQYKMEDIPLEMQCGILGLGYPCIIKKYDLPIIAARVRKC